MNGGGREKATSVNLADMKTDASERTAASEGSAVDRKATGT